jgi:hypothetical protein
MTRLTAPLGGLKEEKSTRLENIIEDITQKIASIEMIPIEIAGGKPIA